MLFDDDDDFNFGDAMMLGTGYALARHGQDRQTAEIVRALQQRGSGEAEINVEVHVHNDDPEEQARPVNALDFSTVDMPDDWDDYIGQEPLKRQMAVYMNSAKERGAALPHTLLASGYPGVGKTTMARLLAKTMGVDIYELVPPFNIHTLVAAARQLDDRDVLFVDEIHKLSDGGKRGAEILLKVLEDGVAFMPDGSVIPLANITVIGATTDRDKLPEPVIDRFKIKPYFQAYSWPELAQICMQFAYRKGAGDTFEGRPGQELAVDIAAACRNTPRILEEMVMAARDLHLAFKRRPVTAELLEFLEVEPDGLTRMHIHYLTAMRRYFARMTRDEEIEYIVGEAAIQQILRETKPGLQRIEGFLVERGLIDRTPRGRRLTDLGIARAEEFLAQGKGAA